MNPEANKSVRLASGRPISVSGYRGAQELAAELASHWSSILKPRSWADRLSLLHQVHEQLQEDVPDLKIYCAVSPLFIREIINLLAGGPVESLAQAHIYANSDDPNHRRSAQEWLAVHQGAASLRP